MFHMKHFGPAPSQNLTSAKQGFAFANVRTADIGVHWTRRIGSSCRLATSHALLRAVAKQVDVLVFVREV
ncbi:MAG: hypothetical protein J2P49_04955 [Methylocapsa sp.]|nr:hypothetical protein [Methylocapsa sp.]